MILRWTSLFVTLTALCFPLSRALAAPSPFGDPVLLVEDHSQVLPHLAQKGLSGLSVLHIDAHDDMWPPPSARQIEKAGQLVTDGDFAPLRKAGDYYAPLDRQLYSINNYLVMAHRLGIVADVYWAYPSATSLTQEELESLREDVAFRGLRRRGEIADRLTVEPPYLKGTLSGVPVTIGALSDFKQGGKPLVLDVDLDFFPPFFESPVKSSYLGILSGFTKELMRLGVSAQVAFISYSNNGAYLPIAQRYLGPWLKTLLADPRMVKSEPPEVWLKKKEAEYLTNFFQPEKVGALYLELLEVEPSNPDYLYNAAMTYATVRKYDKAEQKLREAFNVEPAYILGFIDAAALAGQQKKPMELLRFLMVAEDLAPDSEPVLDAMGRVHYNGSDYPAARAYYQKLIDLGRPSPISYAYLGDTHQALGNLQAAAASYKLAIELFQSLHEANMPLGFWLRGAELHERVGKKGEALKLYRSFIALFPDAKPGLLAKAREAIERLK